VVALVSTWELPEPVLGRAGRQLDPSEVQTGALDSGKSLTTQLTLSKPGTYLLFCPLIDRDGGKPHFAEGLLTTITVK
jgi:hypothetical protein